MTQTNWVIQQLRQHWPNLDIYIEQIRTTGDAVTNVPLSRIGGDGVFVTEIEQALHERRVDLAIHSLKDLPTAQPAGLRVVATGPREDVRDALITHPSLSLSPALLSDPALSLRIGTCSLRRTAQLLALAPHTQILPLRGNVDTRLRKLDAGEYDAIVLASAGLHRLSLHEQLADRLHYLPLDVMLPAPGQGALALEIRDEPELHALLAPLRSLAVEAATSAERMFMRRLGAGCYLPVAAHATIDHDVLYLQGLVTDLAGQQRILVRHAIPWTSSSSIEQAEQLGVHVAEQALSQGAARIIGVVDTIRERERV